jgi:hypothetical protein
MDQAILKDAHNDYLNLAFEKGLVCGKVQNSGSVNFANARDCSLFFINNHGLLVGSMSGSK